MVGNASPKRAGDLDRAPQLAPQSPPDHRTNPVGAGTSRNAGCFESGSAGTSWGLITSHKIVISLLCGMKRFAPLALAAVTLSLCAVEFHPFDGPKPVAVLIQTDPWAIVIGADSPRVAVYEDRMVIFSGGPRRAAAITTGSFQRQNSPTSKSTWHLSSA